MGFYSSAGFCPRSSGGNGMNKILHSHLKYKLCISGAAETGHCAEDALERTKALGSAIVRRNGVLITGATTGAPFWGAIGAKEANGFVIGVSPASSEIEHVKKYRLPIDYHDIIIYTGFGYSGRNLLLTRTADEIEGILEKARRGKGKVVFDSDPKRLVEKVIELVDEEKVHDAQ